MEKNREKAWDQNYVIDWKWWTRLVCNVDSDEATTYDVQTLAFFPGFPCFFWIVLTYNTRKSEEDLEVLIM